MDPFLRLFCLFSAAALFFLRCSTTQRSQNFITLQNSAAFAKKIPAATHGKTHRDREFYSRLAAGVSARFSIQ
jgi:hypothetical protein